MANGELIHWYIYKKKDFKFFSKAHTKQFKAYEVLEKLKKAYGSTMTFDVCRVEYTRGSLTGIKPKECIVNFNE